MGNKNNEKLWTSKFILILAINALNGLALYISNPIMTRYLVARGVEFEYTGIISSLLSWVAMFFRPFSGAMSDNMNKKKLLIFSYLATGLCLIMYSMIKSVPLIIVIRIVHGVAFAVSGTISMSFATSFVPKSRTAEGISYLGIATIIGSMLGPQIGTTIFNALGVNSVFHISSVFCIACLILINFVKYEKPKTEPNISTKLKLENFFAKELLIYVLLIAILTLGNGIISYYLVDFGDARGIANISLFFTVYSVVLLCSKPFIGKTQDKKGIKTILYPAFIVYMSGIVILAKSYTLLPVLFAAVCKAMGQGNGTPAIQAESIKKIDSTRSGVALSTCFIGQDIGNALGPIFASAMINTIGYENMFLTYAGVLLIGFIIYFVYNKTSKLEVTNNEK